MLEAASGNILAGIGGWIEHSPQLLLGMVLGFIIATWLDKTNKV